MVIYLLIISPITASKAATNEGLHKVSVTWLLDVNQDCETSPPFAGTSVIWSTSFNAVEGTKVDVSHFTYNPAGASYWQEGFINYNGTPCMIEFTYGDGGKGIDSNGNPVDGLSFEFDPFGNLTMPGTDVNLYYIYTPYYNYQEPELNDSLDKIVIYINRPHGDINPVKQKYEVYEIFHVNKAKDVKEDVTNDYTVGQTMPENAGFSYWISPDDVWFNIIKNCPYFDLEETTDPNHYNVTLNDNYSHKEATAIEIAKYLEKHIPNGATPKVITADSPSYDNDPGYYLIISEINSNLILGTSNIAITEKAEYPKIEKTVNDNKVEIGQIVTFTINVNFPEGSKAESIITDTMTEGLTYIDGSIEANAEGAFQIRSDANGWIMTFSSEVIKERFKDKAGTIKITYKARVNDRAVISSEGVNMNTAKLDFSHFTTQSSVTLDLKEVTLLKYNAEDESKQPLPGAKFELLDEDKNPISLIAIEDGKEYKIADENSIGKISNFTTGTDLIVIKGLAEDETYYFKEIEAPAGYNLYGDEIEITGDRMEIGNTTGGSLPSTGGIGTTIFYTIGGLLIIGAATAFIAKKRKKFDF